MFTGIIETVGSIISIDNKGTNRIFFVQSSISAALKPDQSVSHNGVCLTIEEVKKNIHQVTAIHETLVKADLGKWKEGDLVNLERCLTPNGRLDGHFVQGHVDTTAVCIEKIEMEGSWQFRFEFPDKFAKLIIEKGSIALNGISLTVFDVTERQFSVAIIPYTFEHTNMKNLNISDTINLEFDMIGKYVVRGMELSGKLLA